MIAWLDFWQMLLFLSNLNYKETVKAGLQQPSPGLGTPDTGKGRGREVGGGGEGGIIFQIIFQMIFTWFSQGHGVRQFSQLNIVMIFAPSCQISVETPREYKKCKRYAMFGIKHEYLTI